MNIFDLWCICYGLMLRLSTLARMEIREFGNLPFCLFNEQLSFFFQVSSGLQRDAGERQAALIFVLSIDIGRNVCLCNTHRDIYGNTHSRTFSMYVSHWGLTEAIKLPNNTHRRNNHECVFTTTVFLSHNIGILA